MADIGGGCAAASSYRHRLADQPQLSGAITESKAPIGRRRSLAETANIEVVPTLRRFKPRARWPPPSHTAAHTRMPIRRMCGFAACQGEAGDSSQSTRRYIRRASRRRHALRSTIAAVGCATLRARRKHSVQPGWSPGQPLKPRPKMRKRERDAISSWPTRKALMVTRWARSRA